MSTVSDSSLLKNVHVVLPYVNVGNLKKKYKHWRNVEVQLLAGPIDLLIGQDCPRLLRQLEAKYGMKDEPYTVRTVLGWSICCSLGKVNNSRSVQLVYSPLDCTLSKFWEIEKVPKKVSSNRELSNIQEKTQRTCIQTGNRYQVRLSWTENKKKPGGSYDMTIRRLTSKKTE